MGFFLHGKEQIILVEIFWQNRTCWIPLCLFLLFFECAVRWKHGVAPLVAHQHWSRYADWASLKTICISTRCILKKKKRCVHILVYNIAFGKVRWLYHVNGGSRMRKSSNLFRCVAVKVNTVKMLYLWNGILCWCWCFISSKIRQGSTFCYSIYPKAFIKLAFVRIVELSITVPLAIPPGAFIPVSICLDRQWKVTFSFAILPH